MYQIEYGDLMTRTHQHYYRSAIAEYDQELLLTSLPIITY